MDQKITVAHMSGGYDSCAAIVKEIQEGWFVYGMFINYGQPYAAQEEEAAFKFGRVMEEKHRGKFLRLPPYKVDLGMESASSDYFPVRNLVLTAMAANVAVSCKAHAVTVGNKTLKVRADDPYSFSDCSVSFYAMLQAAIRAGQEPNQIPIEVRMPLVTENGALSKAEVLKILLDEGFTQQEFWSCYKAGSSPCGECYHCIEIGKALQDPIITTKGVSDAQNKQATD